MRVALHPHPTTADGPRLSIGVHLERDGDRLRVRFVVDGAVEAVVWPKPAEAVRTDKLWQRSCFEVFVSTSGGYREFNLSPSGQWASYRFNGYREGMADAAEIVEVSPPYCANGMIVLEVGLGLPSRVGKLGLSAVIEAIDGSFSYWALAHPSDKPDFHHPDSFVLELP